MISRWPRLLPLLALLYLPFIGGGFLTDDFAHIDHLTRLERATHIIKAPDAFGFYRPVTQASIALDMAVHGNAPPRLRALNVAIHAGVIAMAFLVSRLILQSAFAALLTTLAFALTPKAHPIAVLWISARADLLMALFSFAAVGAWIVWMRGGRVVWAIGAAFCYGLALLSKETATLLPLLLLLTPRSERPLAHRAAAVAGMVALAVLILAWRSQVGALTPLSGDTHYDLMTGLGRWLRSAQNYTARMIAAPLALPLIIGLVRVVDSRWTSRRDRGEPVRSHSYLIDVPVIVFAAAWVVVFIAPVLPITLRSELYLYLPVFGVCLFVGWLSSRLFSAIEPRPLAIALGLYVVGLSGYQVARSVDIHRDLVFSEQLVSGLRGWANSAGVIVLVPSDDVTDRFLRDAVGGYLYRVVQHATGNPQLTGVLQSRGDPPRHGDLRLLCTYRQDIPSLIISPAILP
jgi:hypothetical protein